MRVFPILCIFLALVSLSVVSFADTIAAAQPQSCTAQKVTVVPSANNHSATVTTNTTICEGQKEMYPNTSASQTKKVESQVFFVGTPILARNWELVSTKDSKAWYSLLDDGEGITLIGSGVIKPVKKIIIVTEDDKRYDAEIVPNKTTASSCSTIDQPRALTDKEMLEIHGEVATPQEIEAFKTAQCQSKK